jgi:hypothetical protein
MLCASSQCPVPCVTQSCMQYSPESVDEDAIAWLAVTQRNLPHWQAQQARMTADCQQAHLPSLNDAAGMVKMMDNDEEMGPINIGNPTEFTMLELAKVR